MKRIWMIGLVIGIVVIIGSVAIGMTIYNQRVNDVIEGKHWQFVKEVKVPHSTFYAGFLNESYGMTVGYHGATFVTSDGGQTWQEGLNEANCRFGLDILSEKYLWTVGNYGGNRVSTNGGKTLFDVTDLPLIKEIPNNLVDILDEHICFVGSPLRLAYTTDEGKTWSDIQLPEGLEKLAGMNFLALDKGYLKDYLGQIYYTQDRGETWLVLGQMPVNGAIRFDETPSVTMRVNMDDVITVVYSDKDEGIYSYQADLSEMIAKQLETPENIQWVKVQLEDRPRAIAYLSKDGQYLTTVDIRGNIHLFILEKDVVVN